MRFTPIDPPRVFEVGHEPRIPLKDCARLELEADEQVTFVAGNGAEYDVTRKSWGYYATPSLNGRLAQFGLRAALVITARARVHLLLVERGHESDFHDYLEKQNMAVLCWLDTDAAVQTLQDKLGGP